MFDSMVFTVFFMSIETDEERDFVIELYHSYKRLFYKVALRYFGNSTSDVDDAVGSAVEDVCRYVSTIRKVPCNNLPAYMLSIIERACIRRMAAIAKYRQQFLLEDISEIAPNYASADIDTIFSYANALELLDAYGKQLTERDKMLIRMRHIDMMEYSDMAKSLHMSEGAIRTALSRAKQRLQTAVAMEKR